MGILKSKTKGIIESASVGIVLLVVFLPVRLMFVKYVSTDWLGSFGIITAVSLVILILANKNKLGWFGRAYQRQLYKANRGKRKYFFYFNLIVGIIFFTLTIIAINIGQSDDQFKKDVLEIKNVLPYDNLTDMTKQAEDDFRIEDLPKGLFLFFYMLIFRFDLFIVLMTTLNDLSDGWIMHFSTVFFIEELEVLGLLIFYRVIIKKDPESSIST